MREPLISVVMPTYNQAGFIREAIESVLNQSYTNLELIIINNYSTDRTEKIIESFKDVRIRYLKFKNDGVIAASRNRGIQESVGGYIAFIDSDDVWLANKLENQIEYLESNKELGMVYSAQSILGTQSSIDISRYIYNKDLEKYDTAMAILNKNLISCSSVVVKKDIFSNIGYFDEDRDLVGAEDCDLWVRIAMKYKIGFLGKVLSKYRIHADAISQQGRSAKQKLRDIRLIRKYHKQNYIYNHKALIKYAVLYFKAMKYAILNKEDIVYVTRRVFEILR